MKKSLFSILFLLFAVIPFAASPVMATSGACSSHGGVNCSAGADYDGSVICNDGWTDSSVSYYSMVSCSSNSSPTYSTPSYQYTPSFRSTVSTGYICPLFSHKNTPELDQKIKKLQDTIYGTATQPVPMTFITGEKAQVEQRNLIELNRLLDEQAWSQECTCNDGYVWNENNTMCIMPVTCPPNSYLSGGLCYTYDSLCKEVFGSFSTYNQQKDNCVCSEGYTLDSATSKCVKTPQLTCMPNSYLYGNSCYCNAGYALNSSSSACIKTPPKANTITPTKTTQTSKPLECSGFACPETSQVTKNVTALACPRNSLKNKSLDQCICNKGYQMNKQSNICQKVSATKKK